MQSDNSLPLFSWAQRSAAITPFPHSRRIGKVRQVAETLLERKTERTREELPERNTFPSPVQDAQTRAIK